MNEKEREGFSDSDDDDSEMVVSLNDDDGIGQFCKTV
ncbi:unnamed protein product [Onchocerca flexuosa]|uniref:Uncharacterized protein n=1 Tax=Onchocerca flexuosa TaxID=387005 RepID=A0A183HW67_9BILA|nr:unnamed protein product [Onchocerca flexuosa]